MAFGNAVNATQNGVQTINNGTWTGSSLTQHSVLVGGTSSAITSLVVGGTGTLLVGISGADPAFATSAEGDFSFTQSSASSATNRKISIINDDTSSSASNAQFIAQTGGTSSGDPMNIWSINGGTAWSAGIDRSASSAWVLSRSTSLGTNNALSVSTSNALTLNSAFTFPTTDGIAGQVMATNGAGIVSWANNTNSTVSFSAYLNNNVTNATGDGTPYTIICDVAPINVGGGYNTTTGQFTAPVTGKYFFSGTYHLENVEATSTDGSGYFGVPGGMFYDIWTAAVSAIAQGGNDVAFSGSIFLDLTAGDVVTAVVNVSNGNKQVGLKGLAAGTTYYTFISGFLVA